MRVGAFRRRARLAAANTSNLLLVSMTVVLDTVSLWLIGVADWLADSRCVKREVSRPLTATATVHAMVNFSTLIWDLSVVYGQPAAYHRATGPPCG